jgi:nucleoside-diphosphate-sugar epimerase
MRLLVTGSSGFLGRYVVLEALRRGHTVRAMLRTPGEVNKYGWPAGPALEVVQADLRSRKNLPEAVAGVDAVLHLAAAKAGDVYAQYGGTVVATENLLWAMTQAGVKRIVHVSSFSVYDYMKMREWSLLDENTPVEHDAFDRDGYAHTKLVQENLVRGHAQENGWTFTVLRPGMIFGKDNLWNARIGTQAGRRLWIRTGAWAKLPLTYVENVAEAIVLSAERAEAAGQTLNVVDDDTPSQRQFVSALRRRQSPRPFVLPVSWTAMRALARSAWLTNKYLLGNRAKVPSLLVPCRLHARLKPLRFSNQKIKTVLGWKPRYALEEAIDRSLGEPARLEAEPSGTVSPAMAQA